MKLHNLILSIFVLLVAFAIHEYGHLKELQKRNVEIEEFSLGIGRVLFEYRTESGYNVNFRLIPIMAYVKPKEAAAKLFYENASLMDKVAVFGAGVRNNLFAGLVPVFFLQILGWKKGNISLKELRRLMVMTPVQVMLRFVALLVGCATLGRVNLTEKYLLSTGRVNPPFLLRAFIILNVTLGIINLCPVPPPLDGCKIFEAVLNTVGIAPSINPAFGFLFFMFFFILINDQDMRVLQVDEQKKEEVVS